MRNSIDKMNKKGFTLIELMVVMIILGILATIGFTSFQNSQKKGRDGRRKNDLRQVTLALEAYYNDYGRYPSGDANGKILGCGTSGTPTACNWREAFKFTPSNAPKYMIKLPKEPKGNWYYRYILYGAGFQIYARLENTEDPDVPLSGSVIQNYGISCGEKNCNYGISSSNITPSDGKTLIDD